MLFTVGSAMVHNPALAGKDDPALTHGLWRILPASPAPNLFESTAVQKNRLLTMDSQQLGGTLVMRNNPASGEQKRNRDGPVVADCLKRKILPARVPGIWRRATSSRVVSMCRAVQVFPRSDAGWTPARWDEPQSGTRQARPVLVVPKVCAGRYGAGRASARSASGAERIVG